MPARGPGRHGAVVLVHGSGPETRWGTSRYIADRLARAGIAALIYDKRGSGASGGDWRTASFEDLARDALAGVDLLDARPGIDPARIGIHGHSQGGVIGPLAATLAPGKIAFVVAEDMFAGAQYSQDLYRVRQAIKELALSAADEAKAMEIYALFVDVSRGARTYEEFEKASAPYRETTWYKWMEFPPRDSWVWGVGREDRRFRHAAGVAQGARAGAADLRREGRTRAAGRKHRRDRCGTGALGHALCRLHRAQCGAQSDDPTGSQRTVLLVAPGAGVVDTVVDWIGARVGGLQWPPSIDISSSSTASMRK